MTAPVVTVIVPARNSDATLPLTLEALARQELDGDFDIIVVDDPDAADRTAEIAGRGGARVISRPSGTGVAEARTTGAAAASTPYLAFTDADCEPTPTWLAEGLRALADADLVQGAVAPVPGVRRGPYDRTLNIPAETGLWESANLFVRREALEAVGGFRSFLAGARSDDGETLPGRLPGLDEAPFGEDAWFGWRVRRSGYRTAFAPRALVHHAVFPRDWRGYVAERDRARYFPALVGAVPELRGYLFLRWFVSKRSAAFDLAAVSLTLAAVLRRPWLVLGALPYLRLLGVRPGAGRGHLTWAARELPADATRARALVRGSADARTVVL